MNSGFDCVSGVCVGECVCVDGVENMCVCQKLLPSTDPAQSRKHPTIVITTNNSNLHDTCDTSFRFLN